MTKKRAMKSISINATHEPALDTRLKKKKKMMASVSKVDDLTLEGPSKKKRRKQAIATEVEQLTSCPRKKKRQKTVAAEAERLNCDGRENRTKKLLGMKSAVLTLERISVTACSPNVTLVSGLSSNFVLPYGRLRTNNLKYFVIRFVRHASILRHTDTLYTLFTYFKLDVLKSYDKI